MERDQPRSFRLGRLPEAGAGNKSLGENHFAHTISIQQGIVAPVTSCFIWLIIFYCIRRASRRHGVVTGPRPPRTAARRPGLRSPWGARFPPQRPSSCGAGPEGAGGACPWLLGTGQGLRGVRRQCFHLWVPGWGHPARGACQPVRPCAEARPRPHSPNRRRPTDGGTDTRKPSSC